MRIVTEAAEALHGSLLLAARRDEAFAHFNLSAEGFWRSFAAVLVIAPLYLYADRVDALNPLPGSEPVVFAPLLSLAILIVEWIAWPVAMALITLKTRFSRSYARYITVYNWSSIVVFVLMLMPFLALDLGLVGADQAAMAGAVLLIVALWYRWLVARMALEASALVALALVGGDVVLSLAVHRLISG